MNTENTKYKEKITELNTLLTFVENNILDELLQKRYIKVLRFQKALIRDIDRKGRKIPENIPFVCEITGVEVNTIREKEPPFKLKRNIKLGNDNDVNELMLNELLNDSISHNSYEHLLNNYSLKGVKKLLGRKLEFDDLSSVQENIIVIMELLKHKSYYKKYTNIKSFEKQLQQIIKVVEEM